jgi:hypothetical protein
MVEALRYQHRMVGQDEHIAEFLEYVVSELISHRGVLDANAPWHLDPA